MAERNFWMKITIRKHGHYKHYLVSNNLTLKVTLTSNFIYDNNIFLKSNEVLFNTFYLDLSLCAVVFVKEYSVSFNSLCLKFLYHFVLQF